MDEEYNRRIGYVLKAARELDKNHYHATKIDTYVVSPELMRNLHYALITLDSYNKRVQ